MTDFIIRNNSSLGGTNANDTVYVGDSNHAVSDVTVDTGAGNDQVVVQNAARTLVELGDGNDQAYINSGAVGTTVSTGSGIDTVTIFSTDTNHIDAGAGNNVIQICADTNLVVRGVGTSESLSTFEFEYFNGASLGSSTLIGAGNAVLNGTSGGNMFAVENGNNTIVGYGGEDTIRFAVEQSSVDGNDVILIGADGSRLVVKNGAGHYLNVQADENSAPVSSVFGDAYTISPQDVIKKFMHSLNETTLQGSDALDEAVCAASNGVYSSMSALISDATLDCRTHGADQFLRDDCGIILDNADTGAVTGWDMGGSSVKDAESIVPEDGDWINFGGNSFTVDGVTVRLEREFNLLTSVQKQIVRGLYTWWTKGGLDLVKESYGDEFSFDEGDVQDSARTITLRFVSSGSFLAQVNYSSYDGETAHSIELQINMRYYNSLASDNVNGESSNESASYLDRTLAHEFTHAIMAATVNDFGDLPAYVKEGMAELTHGIDDTRGNDIEALASSASLLSRTLVDGRNVLSSFSSVNAPSYAGGYILLRYMANKLASFDELGDDTIVADNQSAEILSYSGGNLLIENYNYNDTLELINASIEHVTTDGGDLIFETSDGSITLKNMTNHAITVKDANGQTTTQVYGNGYSPQDVIKKFMHSMAYTPFKDGTALDEAIRSCSEFGSMREVVEQMIRDCRNAPDAETFLKDYCGIILDNDDTGAISGWDAGGLTAKTTDTILDSDAEAEYPSETTFTRRDFTLTVPERSSLTADEQLLVRGLYSWWLEGTLELLEESYGLNFVDDSEFNAASVEFYTGAGTSPSATYHNRSSTFNGVKTYNNSISINMNGRAIDADDKSGGKFYSDFTHEMTHAMQYAHFKAPIGLFGEGMAELTYGVDQKWAWRINNLASDADLLAEYVGTDGDDEKNYYVSGYMFWRYLAKQASDSYDSSKIYSWTDNAVFDGTDESELLTAGGEGMTLNAGAGSDTITAYGANVVILAGDGDDLIYSRNSGLKIVGGSGDDTISISGAGNVIEYASGDGNDLVFGFDSDDTLALSDGAAYSTLRADDDVIVSLEGTSITIAAAGDRVLNIDGGSLVGNVIVNGNDESIINGSDSDDTITNLGSNVSINGGAGNDLIRLDNGSARIEYASGDGNDTVKGFSSSDTIRITDGASYSTMLAVDDVIISVESGSIRLLDAATVETINIIGGTLAVQNYYLNNTRNSLVSGSDGADTIINRAGGSTLLGGGGDDTIYNSTSYALEQGYGYVTIDGGLGSDTINSFDAHVSINGGAGDDSINTNGYTDLTVRGGSGNDTIVGSGSRKVIQYSSGDGDDVIVGLNSSDTISILDDISYTTLTSGSNVIISVDGGGSITLNNASTLDAINIDGGTFTGYSARSYYLNYTRNSLVSGSDGADTIINRAGGSTLLGGGGDDTIYNSTSYALEQGYGYVTIDGGSGSDTINSFDAHVSINGGDGDDSINTNGYTDLTVRGGSGNDTIVGSGSRKVIQYSASDGDDVIVGLNSSDTISILDEINYTTLTSDSDVIISVDGGGSIALNNASTLNSINIDGGTFTGYSARSYYLNYTRNSLVSGSDGADTIINRAGGSTLLGGGGDDTIYNSTSYALEQGYGYVTIDGGLGSDSINSFDAHVSINGGDGDDSINTNGYTDLTVRGGLGNDTIVGSGSRKVIQYSSGDGDDLIVGLNSSDTISLLDDVNYTTLTSDSNLIISVDGGGSITLNNAATLNSINIVGGTFTGYSARSYYLNYTRNSLVSGSDSDDTIINRAGGSTLFGGGGDDTINSSTSYALEQGYGYVTIDGGLGSDTINSFDAHVSINGGDGDDSINTNGYTDLTVRGGLGNDTIVGSGSRKVLQYSSGDGDDVIVGYQTSDTISILDDISYTTLTSGSNVIISVDGGGSITLNNASTLDAINIDGGTFTGYSARSYYLNNTRNSLISGSDGADTIINRAGGSTLLGGGGDDTIYSSTSYALEQGYGYVTIDGGLGSDTINSFDAHVSINGGSGDDSINTNGYTDLTVRGGVGDDTIVGSGSRKVIQYSSGDGDDVIVGLNSSDTISFLDDVNYTTLTSGSNFIISVDGGGSLSLNNAATLNSINIEGGNFTGYSARSYYLNYTRNSLVSGSDGADTIINRAGGSTLLGGGGDDTIYSSTSYALEQGYGYVTIDGGLGNDTINSFDAHVSINGGSGDDSINTNGYTDLTVRGGSGNDTIVGSGSRKVIQYSSGDGDDVIVGLNSSDTISILDDINYTTLTSGSNVIISVDGGGSLTLNNAATLNSINIVGGTFTGYSARSYYLNYTRNSLVSGSDGADTIINRAGGSTLLGGGGNDTIYSSTSYALEQGYGYVTIDGGSGSDTINSFDAHVSINGGDGDDSINTNGYTDLTVRGGLGNDTIVGSGSRKVIQYSNGDGDDIIVGLNSSDTISLLNDINYTTLSAGSDVIISIEGGSLYLRGAATLDHINIVGATCDSSHLADPFTNYTPNSLVSGTPGADTITNYAGGVTLRALDGDDSIFSSTGNDYTVNGDYGYVTIDAGAGNDTIVSYDSNVSINAGSGDDYIDIGSWSHVTVLTGPGNDTIDGDGSNRYFQFDFNTGNDRILNVNPTDTVYITFEDLFATLESDNDLIVSLEGGSITLDNAAGMPIKILGGTQVSYDFNKVIDNSADGVTLLGSSVNDSIINRGSNVFINAADGNDTIANYGSNVTLNGGSGADVFRLGENSSAHITDINAIDTLDILSSNIGGFVYTISDDGLTLVDDAELIAVSLDGVNAFSRVADVEVRLNGSTTTLGEIAVSGDPISDGIKVNKSGKTVTVKKPFGGVVDAIDYGSNVKTINAASDPNAVELIGNELDNVLKASKGGSTLDGGGGNDQLVGGKGADVFVYDGRGNDVIKKYKAGQDVVRIAEGEIDAASVKGSKVILTVGDGTLTINNIAKKELTIIDADGVESRYVFTKRNNDLESARISTSAQTPTEEYWFEAASDLEAESPLSEIVTPTEPIALPEEKQFEVGQSPALAFSASRRFIHRDKK